LGGRPAEPVNQEIQRRTAAEVFRVLGELKGGAMKLGQALSVFEAALPPEIAGPYRATLTRLQESAPPWPARTRHKVLAGDMGEDWRASFAEFDDQPAAAASIGKIELAELKVQDVDFALGKLAERFSTRSVRLARMIPIQAIRHSMVNARIFVDGMKCL